MINRVQMQPPAGRAADVGTLPEDIARGARPPGIALHPNQGEVWVADSMYGYVYGFDVSSLPPHQSAAVPLSKDRKEQPHASWIGFGKDGRYLYTDIGAVIDTRTRKLAARIEPSETLVEVEIR
jgi:DNA-binding beta-propeller fold protein YncE